MRLTLFAALFAAAAALAEPRFSTAGFYAVEGSPRTVASFNPGWRFYKGDAKGAEAVGFDDSAWASVNLPHTLDLLPLESSGSDNYQGPAWYRKTFDFTPKAGMRTVIHFEAVMGKSTVWINGKEAFRHFGGYLPLHVDATAFLKPGLNTVAVWADNGNDPLMPPGKPQEHLDFCYYGGIYRDAWLVTTASAYLATPNEPGAEGFRFATASLTDSEARLAIAANLANAGTATQSLRVTATLAAPDGTTAFEATSEPITVAPGSHPNAAFTATVKNPLAWSPDSPRLYTLTFRVTAADGALLDAQAHRVGIHTFAFNPKEGFILNGKPYPAKLIGANRHQDFAHIGNALSNSLHYRDALLLREAGCRLIRASHYPQDPAFMDACDELGLFVVVAVPGWQHWSKDPLFTERMTADIRHMVLRDRNHASTLLWEPVPNETYFPEAFSHTALKTVRENLPAPYPALSGCGEEAPAQDRFEVIYRHTVGDHDRFTAYTPENAKKFLHPEDGRISYTREFGDCVDDWGAQNSISRALKQWGEEAQIKQAIHYTHAPYIYSNMESQFLGPRSHFAATLWHAFDHGRGYHPDNFYGGIMDATRLPKYAYHAFKAALTAEPFVFIAHELTPFSPADVTCFSNCDEVRLTIFGKDLGTRTTRPEGACIPHAPVTFQNAYHFLDLKDMTRGNRYKDALIVAEGLVGGKVVARAEKRPAYRASKITLTVNDHGLPVTADGSDLVTVTARITDRAGTQKHLETEAIRFTVEGPAEIVDDGTIHVNPQITQWGEATILLRAGSEPGRVTVRAELDRRARQAYPGGSVSFTTRAPALPQLGQPAPPAVKGPVSAAVTIVKEEAADTRALREQLEKATEELNRMKLEEVGRQQAAFEKNVTKK